MIIHLNENRFNKFFLLTESKNSSRAKNQTLAILAQVFKTEPDSEEAINAEQNFRKKIFDDLHLTNKEYDRVIKYEPLFMRCTIDIGYEINASFLKKYTDYIIFKTKDSPNPSEIMSRYMSANSFMDLYRLVNADMKADKEAGVEVEDNTQYNLNQNYNVLGPLTFEQAQVYGNESGDNGRGKICYTQGESTWNSPNYSNGGKNKCYLLLRKDWKVVPCMHDGSEARNVLRNGLGVLSEYNGYDNYGLSMIFVFITPYGELHECNTRWNHEAKYGPNRGVDHALTEGDIARLMDAPFEKVFGIKKIDHYTEINERLANGKPVNDLVKIVGTTSNNYKIIFFNFGNFEKKYNFMKEDGTVVWDRPVELWLDCIDDFENGIARVKISKKWNFIREDGTLVWDYPPEKWFDGNGHFMNGFALVSLGRKFNYLREDGTLVWNHPAEEWFDDIYNFNVNGIALVEVGKKVNYLREDGTIVWDYPPEKWFDSTYGFSDGVASVKIGDKWNFLREDGTLVWDYPVEKWFYSVSRFENGIARVKIGRKNNFLKQDGTLVWDYPLEMWFDSESCFSSKGLAPVNIGEKCNFLKKDGTLVWDYPLEKWFDFISSFENGFASVNIGKKWNLLREDGTFVWICPIEKWPNFISSFYGGPARIKIGDKWNFMRKDETLVWNHPIEEWFDSIGYFTTDSTDLADVSFKGKPYKLSKGGKLYDNDGNFVSESKNSKKSLITESKNSSKAKSQTLAILAQALGTEPDSERVIKGEQAFRKKIFDSLHLTNKEYDRVIKYEPLFMRCALEIGYQINVPFLKRYTDYIIFKTKDSENPSEIMSRYMSASSFMDLYRIVMTDMKADKEAGTEVENNAQYTLNQNYYVLGPLTFEQAQVYGSESGNNGRGKICYTQGEDTWNDHNYSNGGKNKCYLLLRKDWESVPYEHDGSEANNGLGKLSEYDGYDDYGLSMIFVFITPNGELHECNTRWNHEADYGPGRGVDHALTEDDISNLMGAPFEKVFGVKKTYHCSEINERIANDESIEDLCEIEYSDVVDGHEVRCVSYEDEKYNVIGRDGKAIWKKPVELWFDEIDGFEYGVTIVTRDEQTNLMNLEGKILSNIWFDYVYRKIGHYYMVNSNDKFNFIREDGTLVWNHPVEKWFDGVNKFINGYSNVCLYLNSTQKKWNFLREDGTLVWNNPVEKWPDFVSRFGAGLALVGRGGKWNFLRTDETFVWDYPVEKWFDDVDEFDNGVARIRIGEKHNFLRVDGTFVWDYPLEEWFDFTGVFYNGVALVCFNHKCNFLRPDGTLIWNHPAEEWFDKVNDCFTTDLTGVQFKGKWYKLSKDGKLYDDNGNLVSESNNSKKTLITESKNSSRAKKQAIAILSQVLNTSPDDERILNAEQMFRKQIFDSLHLQSSKEYDRVIMYEPLFIKCALDVGFPDNFNVADFKVYTDYIINRTKDCENPSEMISRYRNSINTADDLVNVVQSEKEKEEAEENERMSKMEINLNQNYDVLGPLTFEQAQVYGNESGDNGRGKICYTQGEGTWNGPNYSNKNQNKCYLLLRKDWKSVPCRHDGSEANNGISELSEYNGYDSYGLSMIFVFIRPSGALHECNTRWNHEAKYGPGRGVDHALTKSDIAQIMGAPFEKVFNLNIEELSIYIKKELSSGKHLREIFDDYKSSGFDGQFIVCFEGSYNILRKDKTFIWDKPFAKWFDSVIAVSDDDRVGHYAFKLNGKANYVTQEGTVLCKDWFDKTYCFYHGLGCVEVGGKKNFVREDGSIVWNHPIEEWFDDCYGITNGYRKVSKGDDMFLLDINGNLISDYLELVNKLLHEGESLDNIFDRVGSSNEIGDCIVCLNHNGHYKYNILTKDRTFVWNKPVKEWFDSIRFLNKGFSLVLVDWKHYVLDRKEKLYEVNDAINLFAENGLDQQCFFWDYDEILGEQEDGGVKLYRVRFKPLINQFNYLYNVIREDGRLLYDKPLEEWFASILSYIRGDSIVVKDRNLDTYFLGLDGNLHEIADNVSRQLSEGAEPEVIFDNVDKSERASIFFGIEPLYKVALLNNTNFMTKDGKFVFDKPYNQWPSNVLFPKRMIDKMGVIINKFNLRNFIRKDCSLVWNAPENLWFEWIDYTENFICVELKNGLCNVFNYEGKLLWNKPIDQWIFWVDGDETSEGFIQFEPTNNSDSYYFDKDGNIFDRNKKLVKL